MTRRLVVALLALIVAVVVGAMVPLGINAAGNDRLAFVNDVAAAVRTYAAIDQPPLSGMGNATVLKAINTVESSGDGLGIMATTRPELTSGIGRLPGNWRELAARIVREEPRSAVTTDSQTHTDFIGSWVVASTPVYFNGDGQLVGVVLLARSAAPLNSQVRTLWLILSAIGVAALLGATLMAIWLANWVSRPLQGLTAAARRLADGDLEIRARTADGPPELRRLASTFNTMAGRLESLVHGSRAVVADVSHQLRTPLAALRLRLDLLAADAAESDPEMAAEMAGAQDEVARLSRMVDGLLAVARAENVLPQPRAIDIAEVAHERVAAWLPVAEDRTIELTADGFKVVGWLGEGHLEQILDNLIANALDALSPGDRITVRTSDTADGARITVTDNGPGMTPEDRERAFLRFTSKSAGGTGLGLAIVHRLTTSNGGRAALEPAPGGGLVVTLDFPGVPAAQEATGRQASAATQVEAIPG